MPLFHNDILFFAFSSFLQHQSAITHFVSTRVGLHDDVSFTIGLNGFRPDEIVLRNREIIANSFGFKPTAYVFAEQVHGNVVEVIQPNHRGKGAFSKADALQHSDAWITNHPNICLVAQAADCVPILFYDPVNKAIGAAHAGWKGTVNRIAGNVVKAMSSEYGTRPDDLLVGIGPSAGPCCYEVGHDVISLVNREFPRESQLLISYPNREKTLFDLWRANAYVLVEAGVNNQNIEVAGLCTICNNDIFFSARCRDKGRFGGAIMINGA